MQYVQLKKELNAIMSIFQLNTKSFTTKQKLLSWHGINKTKYKIERRNTERPLHKKQAG